jgi:hypothetical protein
MNIIVHDDNEKKLLERFIDVINSCDGIDSITELDSSLGDDCILENGDDLFLTDAFNNAKVEIDKNEYPLCIEHYQITGTCTECGAQTEGTVDGEDVGYSDYLEVMSTENIKTWKCESCINKEREQNEHTSD